MEPAYAPSVPQNVIITQVEYVHDKDLYRYTRTTYTFLDVLRDVGGILGALSGVFTGIVFVLNFNGIYQWLTSKLFRVQDIQDLRAG